ncbi:hypothetical protein ACFQ0B_03260 [Nonomuraea thailandensis]
MPPSPIRPAAEALAAAFAAGLLIAVLLGLPVLDIPGPLPV